MRRKARPSPPSHTVKHFSAPRPGLRDCLPWQEAKSLSQRPSKPGADPAGPATKMEAIMKKFVLAALAAFALVLAVPVSGALANYDSNDGTARGRYFDHRGSN